MDLILPTPIILTLKMRPLRSVQTIHILLDTATALLDTATALLQTDKKNNINKSSLQAFLHNKRIKIIKSFYGPSGYRMALSS